MVLLVCSITAATIRALFSFVLNAEVAVVGICFLVFAMLAELLLGKNHLRKGRLTLAYILYSSALSIGGQYCLFLFTDSFVEGFVQSIHPDFMSQLQKFAQPWVWAILILVTWVAAFAGAMLGRRMLNKSMRRAGIV